jgi:hypothetical protein
MDLFDTLTFAEILGRTTFLGTLSLTVPISSTVSTFLVKWKVSVAWSLKK